MAVSNTEPVFHTGDGGLGNTAYVLCNGDEVENINCALAVYVCLRIGSSEVANSRLVKSLMLASFASRTSKVCISATVIVWPDALRSVFSIAARRLGAQMFTTCAVAVSGRVRHINRNKVKRRICFLIGLPPLQFSTWLPQLLNQQFAFLFVESGNVKVLDYFFPADGFDDLFRWEQF